MSPLSAPAVPAPVWRDSQWGCHERSHTGLCVSTHSSFSWVNTTSGAAGPTVSVHLAVRNCHTVSHSGYIIFHSHQQYLKDY